MSKEDLVCPECGDGLDNCQGIDGDDDHDYKYYVCLGCGTKFDEDGITI